MPSLKTRHIFISHSWDYSNDYNTIKSWFDRAPYFRWSDYSAPLSNPIGAHSTAELKERIRNRISACGCVIVLSGMYVPYSRWIDYEIDIALEMSKPIIGVKPRGNERIPRKVSDNADVVIGWTSSGVVEAVRCLSL